MADYYTEFSETIEYSSDEERDFLMMGFDGIEALSQKLIASAMADGTHKTDHDYFEQARKFYNAEFGEDAASYADDWVVTYKDEGDHLWLHSEESTVIDMVAYVIAAFQKKFKCELAWQMSWSAGCSKPRIGEFGGGAVVVYKGECHWINARSWADDLAKELTDKTKGEQRDDGGVHTTEAEAPAEGAEASKS
jgi:hypothetical protein